MLLPGVADVGDKLNRPQTVNTRSATESGHFACGFKDPIYPSIQQRRLPCYFLSENGQNQARPTETITSPAVLKLSSYGEQVQPFETVVSNCRVINDKHHC